MLILSSIYGGLRIEIFYISCLGSGPERVIVYVSVLKGKTAGKEKLKLIDGFSLQSLRSRNKHYEVVISN